MQTAIANGVPQGTPHFLDHLFAGKAQDVIARGLELHREIKQGVVYSDPFSARIGDLRFQLLRTLIFWGADRDLAALPAWQSVVHRLKEPAILYRKEDEVVTETTLRETLSLPAASPHHPPAERMETIDLARLSVETAFPVLAFRSQMETSLAAGGTWSAETRSQARGTIETLASGDIHRLPESILKGSSDRNIVLGGYYAYFVLFQTCRGINELCELIRIGQKFAAQHPEFKPPLEQLISSRCTPVDKRFL